MQYFSDISNICSGIKLRMVQFIVMLNHLNNYNVIRCTLIKDGKLVFQIQIFYIELYILVHGIQITFCIQNITVHVNICRVIGHKTIKTKQKTNALLILETQNFKTSTLATSATMPE